MRFTVALLLLAASLASRAQVFDMDAARRPLVRLDGMWRFHPGDDPRYAQPGFDDSHWALLKADTDWAGQGYPNLSGIAWYRFQIVVPEHCPPLALYFSRLMTTYEVYEDGVLVGGAGKSPSHPSPDHTVPTIVPLRTAGKPHAITIAIRVWHWDGWASYYGGGPHNPTFVGAQPLIAQIAAQSTISSAWASVDEDLLAILEGLAGIAALGFFYLRYTEREYLWFGLMMLISSVMRCFANWSGNHTMNVLVRDDIQAIMMLFSQLTTIAFFRILLHGRKNWAYWLAIATSIISVFANFLDGTLLTVRRSQEWAAILMLPFSGWVLTLLLRQARRGIADARLLLLPTLLSQVAGLVGNLIWISYLAGWQRKTAAQDLTLSTWPFNITLTDLTSVLFLLAMLAILIMRFNRTRREEERLETELDAARSVQHVLIPEELPTIPGLQVASAYQPASEVGGDFFQIIPLADLGCIADDQPGGALVIVGDVSGKGLQAAMQVSLIVGSLRTLVDHTQRPKEILAGLNRRLSERSRGGFTTCLVMRIDADGSVIAASAGHLPPYRNGREVALDDGLPLGITLDAEYEETRFSIAAGDKLTMISDGVLEARNAAGELFGFDRTRALSTQDATYIAAAAQEFGQEDDITVLTLLRTHDVAQPAMVMVEASQ